jgi:hypothetical protein
MCAGTPEGDTAFAITQNQFRRMTVNTDLAISPRNLGLIMLASFCPRCFWFLIRMMFHPPFNHGGGALWTYMQQIQEAQVGHHLDKNGCLPKEFSPFCNISSRAKFPKHWSKFRYQHKSGVILYGIPDEIFTLADGSLCVIDHKTATNKGKDDPFLPIYNSQTVGYSDIAQNGLGLGEVTKAGLFYWEVQRAEVIDDPKSHYEKGKVWVPFVPKPLEFEVDFTFLDPLLKEAKKLWKSSSPPAGRVGCRDCLKAEAFLALGTIIADAEQIQDRWMLESSGHSSEATKFVHQRIHDRHWSRVSALLELQDQTSDFNLAEDGMIGNWEYFDDQSQPMF